YSFLMNAAVGDILMPQDNTCGTTCEVLKLVYITGNTWVVQRGYFVTAQDNSPQDHSTTSTYGMVASTNYWYDTGTATVYRPDTWAWNFMADSVGACTTLANCPVDAVDNTSHNTFGNTNGAGAANNCSSGENNNCAIIKTGSTPGGYWNQPATVKAPFF